MSICNGISTAIVGISLLFSACEAPKNEPTQREIDQQKMIASLVDRQSANYMDLQTQSAMLSAASAAYCESPTELGFSELRAQWIDTFLSWGKAQWLNQGPVDEDDQFQRIEAWPTADSDRVMQAVEQLLVNAPAEVDEVYIANSPTQVQGFPALEYLLFSGEKITLSARQCDLLIAISNNVRTMTARIDTEWIDVYSSLLKSPMPGFGFSSQNESMNFLMNQYLNLLIVVKDNKLGAPLGFDKEGERGVYVPQASQAWISKQSLSAITANMEVLQELFRNEESFGIDDYLVSLEQAAVSEEIQGKIAVIITQLGELQNMDLLLYEDIEDDVFVSLFERIKELEVAVKTKLFPSIGATITFNFNDGD